MHIMKEQQQPAGTFWTIFKFADWDFFLNISHVQNISECNALSTMLDERHWRRPLDICQKVYASKIIAHKYEWFLEVFIFVCKKNCDKCRVCIALCKRRRWNLRKPVCQATTLQRPSVDAWWRRRESFLTRSYLGFQHLSISDCIFDHVLPIHIWNKNMFICLLFDGSCCWNGARVNLRPRTASGLRPNSISVDNLRC